MRKAVRTFSLAAALCIAGLVLIYSLLNNPSDWPTARRGPPVNAPCDSELFLERLRQSTTDWHAPPWPGQLSDPLKQHLERYLQWIENSMASNPHNLVLSGWEVYPALHSFIDAYLLLDDENYLQRFSHFAEYILQQRADRQQIPDFSGQIRPQWHRLERYNIFHVSPYFSYLASDHNQTIESRGWKNLNFSDVNYSGLFLEPLLRFCQVTQGLKNEYFKVKCDSIIERARETIASHEGEWNQVNKESGYYTFPERAPYYLDGIELPINESAVFGTALLRFFRLTGDEQLFNRVHAMIEHWLPAFPAGGNSLSYPYALGPLKDGWRQEDQLSVNTPSYRGNASAFHETTHKAAITLKLLAMHAALRQDARIHRILRKACNTVSAFSTSAGNFVSWFPTNLGMTPTLDSYHDNPPIYFQGWLEITAASGNTALAERLALSTRAIWHEHDNAAANYLSLSRTLDWWPSEPRETELTISPFLSASSCSSRKKSTHCHLQSKTDAIALFEFQHHTPKNSWIFLSPCGRPNERIRLVHRQGKFLGRAYLTAGQCLDLAWKVTNEHSAPRTKTENRVQARIISLP